MGLKRTFGRVRHGIAMAVSATALMCAAQAHAAERRAVVQGVDDRALRDAIERAIGDERSHPANRPDARRRARQAADSATKLLRSEGYYDAEVAPDIGDGDRPQAVVKIEPGPRTVFVVPEVHWIGEPPPLEIQQAMLAQMGVSPGAPARAAEVYAAEIRLVTAAQERGFAEAKATDRKVEVDRATQTMHVTFNLAAGPLVKLDGLIMQGKTHTHRDWLTHLRPWRTGDVYRPAQVAELERRLL